MKLEQVLEDTLPKIFDTKSVNDLNKKPKKLKKGVYGVGGGPVGLNVSHGDGCPAASGGGVTTAACTCGAGATGGSSAGGDGGGSGGAGGGAGGGM
jgi:hypothetical protein